MSIAFLYAGQGSQHPGMGADLYETYPQFRAVLDGAQLDFDLKEVSFQDSQGVLNETRYTQPCMVAFAVGVTQILADLGITPDYAAGLSLGEYSGRSWSRPASRPGRWAGGASRTTPAPDSWFWADTRVRGTRPPDWPRRWGRAAVCP